MLALRYAGVLALTVWVGGLLVLGAIAAPSIFDVLALRHVADDRLLAGPGGGLAPAAGPLSVLPAPPAAAPGPASSTLCGLMSRWMMPCSWAYCTASAT